MTISRRHFGKLPGGEEVSIFTLENSNGMKAEIINFGGIIVSLSVPDKKGKMDDVVLGFDRLEKYIADGSYIGAIVGRYANRIQDAAFELNGREYKLYSNDGRNHLHGGKKGFNKVLWHGEVINVNDKESLCLSYESADGEEGYPGKLEVRVTYTLTDDNALEIDYNAVSDKDTAVNLTSHSYFNLSGHKYGRISNHQLMINADTFTVNDKECLPTGEILNVRGTPMDFTSMKPIAPGFESGFDQIALGKGYDHNWILNNPGDVRSEAAVLYDPESGRMMEVYTTMPGIQFYTGNYLDGKVLGKDGAVYPERSGLCLETQYFPNSLRHKHFPSPVLKAGAEYHHKTVYKFLTV